MPKFLESLIVTFYGKGHMSAVSKSRILRPRDDSPALWEAWYNDRDLGKREAGGSLKEASETRIKGWKSLKLRGGGGGGTNPFKSRHTDNR